MTKEELEEFLAEGLSLDRIAQRVRRDPSTVRYHLKKHGLLPLGHEVHAPNQKVDPVRLRRLMANGATVREAAEHFGVGYSTIRYWLKKLDIETARMKRLRESQARFIPSSLDVRLLQPVADGRVARPKVFRSLGRPFAMEPRRSPGWARATCVAKRRDQLFLQVILHG